MKIFFLIFALSLLLISACGNKPKADTLSSAAKDIRQLVWSDEFDYEGTPDPGKWMIRNHKHPNWIIQDRQTYEDNKENVRVENGNLIIQAHNKGNSWYTSARLDTYLSGKWTYGRIEVRAKLPRGRGTWPMIYLQAAEEIKPGYAWPASGIIDIMQHFGHQPGQIEAAVECYAYNYAEGDQKSGTLRVADPFDTYHVYAVEWYPDRIDFFVDNQKYYTYKNETHDWKTWPFYKNFYLILSLAINGTWQGAQGIDDSVFPVQLTIDYVRVYQTDLKQLGYKVK